MNPYCPHVFSSLRVAGFEPNKTGSVACVLPMSHHNLVSNIIIIITIIISIIVRLHSLSPTVFIFSMFTQYLLHLAVVWIRTPKTLQTNYTFLDTCLHRLHVLVALVHGHSVEVLHSILHPRHLQPKLNNLIRTTTTF